MAAKEEKQDALDDRVRAGIPKDWVSPNLQISVDIKFCDMRVEMKDYALALTEYIYVQMVRN